jgi:hypothetical protein
VKSVPKVVEEDREPGNDGRATPGWIWLAIGLILGAGASILALRTDEPAALTSTTSGAAAVEGPEGIGDVIEDFPDGLVAVSRGDGQSLELLVWPLRGEPRLRTIPVGVARPPGPVTFDASSRRIATLLPVPDQAQGVLYAGVPEQAGIVATGVTGYAWHDTEPLRLAYTTFADDELVLWSLAEPAADPQIVTRAVGITGSLQAWGDWGFAIQDEERDSVVLLTESGEIKATQPGRILDADGVEWLAISDQQGVRLLSSGGGVVAGPEGVGGEVTAAAFSPDGDELGLMTSDGASVVSLGTGATLAESAERPGVPEMAWTSDQGHVAYPASRGIVVMDTTDGSSTILLTDRSFTGLGVLPIGNS